MIQIQNTNLSKLVNNHYDKLKDKLKFDDIKKTQSYRKSKDNKLLVKYLENNLQSIIKGKPDVLRGHIAELLKFRVRLEKHPLTKKLSTHEKRENAFITAIRKIFNYDSKISKEYFASSLALTTCPYCNREYIFHFEDTVQKKARTLAVLDHFYDKAKFPFLALSFYNLIPSCHICNSKFKTIQNFYKKKHLHPYEDDFNTRAKFIQCFNNASDDTKQHDLFSEKRIALKIVPHDIQDKATIRTVQTFRLNELYNKHTDVVLELLQKREIYSDSYIDDLFQQYEGSLFKNREDLLRLITCGYVDDEDLGKRPLSKLIKDISEQLGFYE